MVDPNFSGINPANLQRSIDALVGGSKLLHGGRASYYGRFQKYGLDTRHLTEIGKIASWVDDELPMLRRRQALAVAMENDGGHHRRAGGGPAMVRLPEPVMSVASARADGKVLAEDADKAGALARGPGGAEFHRIAGALAAHRGDPDFTSAFYARMDPALVKNLPTVIMAADAGTAGADAKVFGSAFTTAVMADSPAPGFDKTLALFHGPVGKDEPGALFNRALMQGDAPELWDRGWWHLKKASSKLLDPADTWSDDVGLLAGVIGVQIQLSEHYGDAAREFARDAQELHRQRVAAVGKAAKRQLSKATSRSGKAARAASLESERVLAKYGLGSFSRLMEASVGEGAGWLVDKVPSLRPPGGMGAFGGVLRAGGKVPLVGTVLTVGATAWDIEHGTDADVAVAANGVGMAAGALGTWAGVGLVALAGGPVGWGIAAGIVVGFVAGYAASYALKDMPSGIEAVHAVSTAAKDLVDSVSESASDMKRSVSHWFS
ncbi:hypothetical protein AB0436_24360 [Streptomyces sp. NPDC051322]|uniref:hypothetical protein n=1 Tax=Streptomyces sp. NPDC051322 TaxID=3154645 RepID=UPI00344EF64D